MQIEPITKATIANIKLAHEEAERQGGNTDAHHHRRDLLVAVEGMQQIIDMLAWTENDLQMKLAQARLVAELMLEDIQKQEGVYLNKWDTPYELPWE